MSSRYEDKPYKVVRKRGTSVMLKSNNGHIIYRNVSHVRPYFRTFESNTHCENRQNIVRARPHRLRKMPDKFNDFVLYTLHDRPHLTMKSNSLIRFSLSVR